MNITMTPMLALIGLGGGEIILILLVLVLPLIFLAIISLVIFLVIRAGKQQNANPISSQPLPPPAAPVNRFRPSGGLLLSSTVLVLAVAVVAVRVFIMFVSNQRTPTMIPIFLVLFIVLIFGGLAMVVIALFVRDLSRSRRSTTPIPPVHPITSTQILRPCPKCGALLKSDAPEGLCPACLLQHGIATEGGAPPGTPAFTPPPLTELAKLFPQLEILEVIGQGGMGAVYKARQPALDRFVALKILAPRSGGDLDFAGRFSREARALARLSHPNIVGVHDFGTVEQPPRPAPADQPAVQNDPSPPATLHYFIMEFVDGPNLRQLEQAGKLAPREALQIIPQICAALQFAHDEGIVHRDIKPENVLLDKKGRVKIADFGLAKILGQESNFRLTGLRDVMGTPHYMAPEQVEKPQEVDHRADIYSLGVVFYEMLTGELPLGKFDPPSHKVQIDVRLDDVVLRSLANNPDRRYQNVSEVKTELDTIAQNPSAAPAENSAVRVQQPFEYRSASTLFGLPLLHVVYGMDYATGKMPVAKGIVAIGGRRAQGVLAVSGIATGFFAMGGLAVGVFAFGGGAVGLFSFGGLAIALILAMGGGAIAPIAIGGGVLAYMGLGGGGLGAHICDAFTGDPVAKKFFSSWGPWLMNHVQYINVAFIALVIGLGVFVPLRARRRGLAGNGAQILDAARAWLAVMDSGNYARTWELAATYFQHAVKKEDWIAKCDSVRRPLAGVISRTLLQMRFLGGSSRFVAQFQTAFTNMPTAVETITFAAEPNGEWKAIGYLIKPSSSKRFLARMILMVLAVVGLTFLAKLALQANRQEMDASAEKAALVAQIEKSTTTNLPASAETWAPTNAPGEKPDLAIILQEGRDLMYQGRYEESLQRQIWAHNHSLTDPWQGGIRNSFAMSYWAELDRRYPKAKTALGEIRDQDEAKFSTGQGFFDLFVEVSSINHELNDDDRTYSLFKKIAASADTDLARQCYSTAEKVLAAKGDYAGCMQYIGDPEEGFKTIQTRWQRIKQITQTNGNQQMRERLAVVTDGTFVTDTRRLLEILVGVGRTGDAEKIRAEALLLLDDPGIKSGVDDAVKKISASSSAHPQ